MRRSATSEQGQALVEFALVLPFLLALGTGVVSLGLALGYHNQEMNLASVAARCMAAAPGCPTAQTINQQVLAGSSQELRANAVITVTFEQAAGVPVPRNHCAAGNHAVTVTVTWPDYVLFPMFSLGKRTLTTHSTMRLERDWVGNPVTGVGAPTAAGAYNVAPGSASSDVC